MDEFEINEEKLEEIVKDTYKDIPGYRNITCRKCGKEYSSLFKECPSCKYSPLRQLFKISLFSILTILVIGSLVFLAIRVGKVEERLSDIEESLSNVSDTSDAYDITELSYYQDQLIYDGANLAAFGDDYLIYAMQDDCSACKEANEYIYMYLYYGYPDYLPIYFVTPDSANDIFFETLGCESTPTLYRLKEGVITESAVGVDDVYEMLDKVIAESEQAAEE